MLSTKIKYWKRFRAIDRKYPSAQYRSDLYAWERFQSLALGDAALRAELRVATCEMELSTRAVSLGLSRGLVFSGDDVSASLRTQRRAWLERSIS